ncbi:hypothetical protein WJX84_011527 [Apatococcus fuscideae]|uniref:AB hydrolase-1 domain-containing protein n=1 Tax=Apatococcus fuscideae TaxID=2026836 RepID=A0AAW1T0N4_9CHLO
MEERSVHLVECRGDVNTSVHELGGSGPPLLVLPANGFPSRAYLPCVEFLKRNFRCLGVDLRGNGGDTPSGVGPDVLHFADDVFRVIQALHLTGAYAIGHSVGGTAALRAQAAHPECLSAIYCFEPIIFNPFIPGVQPSASGMPREF